jgi:hypothetical protein
MGSLIHRKEEYCEGNAGQSISQNDAKKHENRKRL